jgi:ribosomal protein L40E
MSKWRWVSWALILWAVVPVLAGVVLVSVATDSNGAAYRMGQLSRAWLPGFVILAVYWRNSRPKDKLCPRCGLQVVPAATVCPRCGYYPGMPAYAPSLPTAAVCPRCGQLVDQRAPSCDRCGYAPGQPIEPARPQP